MASRVRVAASACLVASGLIIAGVGGAMALADPGYGYGQSDGPSDDGKSGNHSGDGKGDDSVGDVFRRAFSLDGNGDQTPEHGQRPQARAGNGRDGQEGVNQEEPPRTGATPTVGSATQQAATDSTTRETTPEESTSQTTKTTTPTTTKSPPPCPERATDCNPRPGGPSPNPPASGGGGGGAIEQVPRFKAPSVPGMQLPREMTPSPPGLPGGPAVLDAGAGAAPAAVPGGAAAPIVLPVMVAPPVGLGAGAGGTGAGATGGPPGVPGVKSIFAEPPGGRISPPAKVSSNSVPLKTSYRLGYTEYLRSADLPQVAALAVPGLAGILVLTGAGGLVGYRQAKAGHAVRVGGSARFMR